MDTDLYFTQKRNDDQFIRDKMKEENVCFQRMSHRSYEWSMFLRCVNKISRGQEYMIIIVLGSKNSHNRSVQFEVGEENKYIYIACSQSLGTYNPRSNLNNFGK